MSAPNVDDCEKFIIGWIRNPRHQFSLYGYDILISEVIRAYRKEEEGIESASPAQVDDYSPNFLAAAWELCRRGIIRPGVSELGGQVTDNGSGGDGYSITPFGKRWLAEETNDIFLPTDYGRFAELLAPFKDLFGPGFHERAQEANRCYRAHAYLACCAMCGAAAESIMLSLAIRKEGDEEKVLKLYRAAGGRGKIENLLTGQVDKRTRKIFIELAKLLHHWRDESAHGSASKISDNEAHTSLSTLFRFVKFAKDNLEALTGHTQ